MSAYESGPRYYYGDPTSEPYHDPSWYRGNDKKDDQKEEVLLISSGEEVVFFKLSDSETLILK